VAVDIADEPSNFDPAAVGQLILDRLPTRGYVLVVCNTVDRAQGVYRELRTRLVDEVVLLHARLTAATRAERTERVLSLLGAEGERKGRLVVVATQLAEQSFDVDADLLVTDLAPIDLLLQRMGRLHRHTRSAGSRPESFRDPRVIITGLRLGRDRPTFPRGSSAVYGDHQLIRAAALVADATGTGWSVPEQVPDLVARGYGDRALGPEEWAPAVDEARTAHDASEAQRAARAANFLLAGEDRLGTETLAGLHDRGTADHDEDEEGAVAVVRDGDPSVEVVLVRREARGYLTLSGRALGPQGEGVTDPIVLEEVVGSTVRLPARESITNAALATLGPLPGWAQDPWLAKARALELNAEMSVPLGTHLLTYDEEVGLIVRKANR
jgi:CRISPR-associated endonuclease/helicase Cas3